VDIGVFDLQVTDFFSRNKVLGSSHGNPGYDYFAQHFEKSLENHANSWYGGWGCMMHLLFFPTRKSKHMTTNNAWQRHLKNFRSSHPGLTLKESMRAASLTYRGTAGNKAYKSITLLNKGPLPHDLNEKIINYAKAKKEFERTLKECHDMYNDLHFEKGYDVTVLDTCFLPQNEYQINHLKMEDEFYLNFVIGPRARSVLVDTFKSMTELRLLEITDSGDDDTIADLLQAISNNSNIKEMYLTLINNNVDVKTVRGITGLMKKKKVDGLWLKQKGKEFKKKALNAISSVADSGLKQLTLELDMQLDGVILLSKILVKNKSITNLGIENSSIHGEKFIQISKSIKKSNIKDLNLYQNGLQDADMIPMQNLLRRSKLRLTHLYLNYNKIGDIGARYLSEVIARNLNIQYLDLTGNKIGDAGAILIALAWVSKDRTRHSTLYNVLLLNDNPGYDYFAEYFEDHWISRRRLGLHGAIV